MPTSPTLSRKASSRPSTQILTYTSKKALVQDRLVSPPPSTPPTSARQLPNSSIRTPLVSKEINPITLSPENDDDDMDINKTPRKRVSSSGMTITTPITPRKLVFPTNQNDSPFRTPIGSFETSPFRTPGSRAIFDPYDPGTLLDEELSRQGDSPAGIFGKGRGSLLYDSPGLSISPGRWW